MRRKLPNGELTNITAVLASVHLSDHNMDHRRHILRLCGNIAVEPIRLGTRRLCKRSLSGSYRF